MLKLKHTLEDLGKKQTELAAHLSLSKAAVAQLVNHGQWPKTIQQTDLKDRIASWLVAAGAAQDSVQTAFEEWVQPGGNLATPDAQSQESNQETEHENMLLRCQPLLPEARRHFELFSDPFLEDLKGPEDLWTSPELRYVREAMMQTATGGGMLAIVSESGAGKTTLLIDLEDRICREKKPVILIKPYMLSAEETDQKGKTLKSTHIAEAIMAAVAPNEKPKSSPEARFQQLHRVLKDSAAAGNRHCVVFDEAHSLPLATIKHLKRYTELKLGYKSLISIILMGQTELQVKLSERDSKVREVVQRCEVVQLLPLSAAELQQYLHFKFKRLGKQLGEIMNEEALDALRARLTISTRNSAQQDQVSLLYPLAVGNVVKAAMNMAAELGVPVITADLIKGV
jgi:type II secretory pathway predicted ATPase ExeA